MIDFVNRSPSWIPLPLLTSLLCATIYYSITAGTKYIYAINAIKTLFQWVTVFNRK